MKTRPSLPPLLFVFVLGGCSKVVGEEPTYTFDLTVRVASDDAAPVARAQIVTGWAAPVTTDADGEAPVRVVGHDGDRRSFDVRCPKDFQSPATPLVVTLHRVAEGSRRPLYEATCTPLTREVVVAVRLEHGANLPVEYLGEEVARTDASGAAHFVVHAVPGEPFRVSVNTEQDEDLRPVNPQREMSVGAADDIVVFDQKFSRLQRVVAPRAPAAPRRPTRL